MSKTAPQWNLNDLYSSVDDLAIKRDIEKAKNIATSFRTHYATKVAGLSAEKLVAAIEIYEELRDLLGRVGSYAGLLYAANTATPKVASFYQNIQEAETEITSQLLFFTLEIIAIEEAAISKMLTESPALAHYTPWLRDVRVFKPHTLPEEMERLLHEKQLASHSAWIRLFDETEEALRFKIERKKRPLAEALNYMHHEDAKKRKAAAKEIGKVLKENARTFTLIMNTLIKDKEIEDNWRNYPKPISARNRENFVEDEVVEALIKTVKKNYRKLSHRYYGLKAKWFNKKVLPYWDRNAPLPEAPTHKYTWEEAQKIVLAAYAEFSPKLAEIGKQFFDKNWIDAEARAGKTSGAFSHPCVPSAHPYILMNFQGTLNDVMTLAHELGHGVHQVLAGKQGALMADTPLTLAETASVFGEQVVFQYLLAQEKNPIRRKMLIADKVEDMLNTVVRQIAFCEFETILHDERRKGELSAERICAIWMKIQKDSLGKAIKFDKDYHYYWAYISHFIHSPFYVYSYAFGDCLVNSLYAAYKKQPKGFEQKYLKMLEAGGTLHHRELLAPFGLDATESDFWQQGLNIISNLINELEK